MESLETIIPLLFVIAGGFLWLRRRLSSDSLAITRHESEKDLLEIVIRERDKAIEDARRATEDARRAWEARTEDAQKIGELTATVEALRQLNHRLHNEVHLLRLHVTNLTRELNKLVGQEPDTNLPYLPKEEQP